jgi:peptidylprolyl isomerase
MLWSVQIMSMHIRMIAWIGALLLLLTAVSGCMGSDDASPAASAGDTVRVHYTGTLDNGTVFDSSVGGDPLEFVVGGGQMITGFDRAVEGMHVGESKTVTLAPEDAYGDYNQDLVFVIDRAYIAEGLDPAVGDELAVPLENGQVLRVTVIGVNETGVTVDGNNRFAGENLTFTIELVEIL